MKKNGDAVALVNRNPKIEVQALLYRFQIFS